MEEQQISRFTTAIFSSEEEAELAYSKALELGYKPDDVNIIMSDETQKKFLKSPEQALQSPPKEIDVAVGSAIGGAIGGTIGAIAAIGTTVLFPGLGLIVAGPLTAALASLGMGAISGGLIGVLIGWGIPEETAKNYEAEIKSGGILLVVHEKKDSNLAREWKKIA
ncbi:hypothetical protein [Legionella jordanis]|uniref:Uncharacterized protein n=1 Tax=Legionella jordanis TaxID=456 RepID=A0A0W0VAZ3_9GAMM|nr:hypothetical protein [Legionella jordanis]KTD17297.1 hypothetical protein Ljor_1603 [Legionella jordanis]RMW99460.1 hypothetical protein EAW55_13725 [Legionella jordanis]RMX15309.1 hypothetical protein EAS68_12570 [Legionella jordanis]VEH12504.1 Uncharacterised protein [Legionella jordanis]HAT8715230.1 hypothetical protein [Legionella jordanis]